MSLDCYSFMKTTRRHDLGSQMYNDGAAVIQI